MSMRKRWTRSRERAAVSSEQPQRDVRDPDDGQGVYGRYLEELADEPEDVGPGFGSAWTGLKAALKWELKMRSIWSGKPSYVGLYGAQSWADPEPLDELLQACFVFVFVERLPQLLLRFRVRGNVDGDVRLHVRNFVHDLQRIHDPLGFHLFGLLRSAVAEAIEAGELFRVEGDSTIRNDTVLSGAPRRATRPLEKLVLVPGGWAPEAVADLFATGPGSRRRAVANLRACVAELGAGNRQAFTFKAALDSLKRDVRVQLATCFEIGQGEPVAEEDHDGVRAWVPTVQPETWIHDLDSYLQLVACVTDLVERHEAQVRTRRHLERLWGFLRRYAVSDEPGLPTHRGLERLLSIPRARLSGLFDVLRGLVLQCREIAETVVDGHFPEHDGSASA